MQALNLHRHAFHGEWNYTIKPTPLDPVSTPPGSKR
jgi:hypothetical protein